MAKVLECAEVDPSSGCTHIVRGQTEDELLKNAMAHTKQHGIHEVTPEMMAKVKSAIREESPIPPAGEGANPFGLAQGATASSGVTSVGDNLRRS